MLKGKELETYVVPASCMEKEHLLERNEYFVGGLVDMNLVKRCCDPGNAAESA